MKFSTLLLAGALTALAGPALANSFTNGGFESLTNGPGQLTTNTTATGWTVANGGYTFAYAPGGIDQPGTLGQYGNNYMWGPNNGANNGLTGTSPSGGNLIAFDGAFQVQPLQQIVTGLTVGKIYSVGFDYGFAQQYGFNGDTVQNWSVSFAGVTHTTASYSLPNHGFSGWFHTSYDFVANNATETLSFLAYGNLPVPPFALLDGVTFTPDTVAGAVPEPASWALLIVGFGLVGVSARRRRSIVAA
jgi:hypothetical protein